MHFVIYRYYLLIYIIIIFLLFLLSFVHSFLHCHLECPKFFHFLLSFFSYRHRHYLRFYNETTYIVLLTRQVRHYPCRQCNYWMTDHLIYPIHQTDHLFHQFLRCRRLSHPLSCSHHPQN